MEHSEDTVKVRGGAEIYWQTWKPEGEPVAVVCLAHGLGEHSGRYGHLARRFTDEGFAVVAHDHRGHGRSSGSRGDLRISDAVSDVAQMVDMTRSAYPDAPLVIYGHSLGALITMTYTAESGGEHVTAQVASAPALDSELREQRLKFAMANLLGQFLPGITIPTGLDSKGVSRDPSVVAQYEEDPLVHDQGSLGLAKQTFAAMDAMMARASFPVPLLVLHGTADRLTVPQASKKFVRQVRGDVTLIEYEGMYHEPHNEPEQEEVFDDVLRWLRERIEA
jgi:alpha-beta hydrolase superfamily lysophospholipase